MSEVLKSRHGVNITRSLICQRPLDVIASLCWSPGDIGLGRVHLVGDEVFQSRKAAEEAAARQGLAKSSIRYFFDWVSGLAGKSGVKREHWLRDVYWPGKEQVANYMFDTAVQAYPQQFAMVASALAELNMESPEWVEVKTEAPARPLIGMPDTVVMDQATKSILLVEIKGPNPGTRYTLDQHIKYLALTALLRSGDFFPGWRVHTLLLGPGREFQANASGLAKVVDAQKQGKPVFSTGGPGCPPTAGMAVIAEQLKRRLAELSKICPSTPALGEVDFRLYFSDWRSFHAVCQPGGLRDNIEFMLPHLLGPGHAAGA